MRLFCTSKHEEPVTEGSSTRMAKPFHKPPFVGKWRFSRFDGRYVFDVKDGPMGFASPWFCDVDTMAEYVTWLQEYPDD